MRHPTALFDAPSHQLLKFNAKAHFVKAVVCHLAAGDTVQATEKLSSFQAADISFEKSREEKCVMMPRRLLLAD